MKPSVSSTGTTTNPKPTKVTFQKPSQPPTVSLKTTSHTPVIGTFSLPAGEILQI